VGAELMRLLRASGWLAAAVAAVMAASCGGEGGTTAARNLVGQREVERSIAAFYGAEPKAACDSLSSAALRQLGGRDQCLRAAQGRGAAHYEVDSVRFAHRTAIAVVRSGGRVIQFTLLQERGAWRVRRPLPALPGNPATVPR
jgi:hypothetical protein